MGRLSMSRTVLISLMSVWAALATLNTAQAGPLGPNRISDITNTPHNLSTTPYNTGTDTRTVKATSQDQICVFCHTPHGADTSVPAPLWNRKVTTATYQMYTSNTMEAGTPAAIAASSKLCLSCHDGTLAIGAVNVLGGLTDQTIAMSGVEGSGKMSTTGATTGYTRNLGIDLRNDHPISITYDAALVTADGELNGPPPFTTGGASPVDLVKARKPYGDTGAPIYTLLPLIPDPADGNKAKVECLTCHDPHIRSTEVGVNAKFLRLSRFQNNQAPNVAGGYNTANDIICVACHNKGGWPDSAHANPNVANETYTVAAATQRGFPADGSFPVWRAACLNCHDAHTVQGAQRLLREATCTTYAGGACTSAKPRAGGGSALEETCFQCHSADGATLNNQGTVNFPAPNIKSEFTRAYRMPITSADQPAFGAEVHTIGGEGGTAKVAGAGKDFLETQLLLGKGNSQNRHVECTDCHNTHRMIRNRAANAANPQTPDVEGTHDHWSAVEGRGAHTNIISGVLRGSWGVEPVYPGQSFFSDPVTFTVKKGNVASGADMSNAITASYVTREYQICYKCHSKYAYDNPLTVGYTAGLTPYNTNGMTQYTSNAREFQAPAGHEGENQNMGAEAGAYPNNFSCEDFGTCNLDWNNHRSWHPITAPTGRSKAVRGIIGSGQWLSPWDGNVGTQTMYCSDCHGQDTPSGTVDPDGQATYDGTPWGPHGSNLPFILKGKYDFMTGTPCTSECNTPDTRTDQLDDLCFKCHQYSNYADPDATGSSGFRKSGSENLHTKHASRLKRMKCMWCHVSTPHGWKNKALLVNLNDLGQELCNPTCPTEAIYQPANQGGDTFATGGVEHPLQVSGGITQPLFKGPYYYNAILKIVNFNESGNWDPKSCGSRKFTGSEGSGQGWMTGTCNNLP